MKFLRSLSRFSPWFLCIIFALYFVIQYYLERITLDFLAATIFLGLGVLGFVDFTQKKHSILRNYPVTGHFRFLLEYFRVEIRQYFIESDREKLPFSRNQRALVYQRSKRVSDQRPFGTINDVYVPGYEWLVHSSKPIPLNEIGELRTLVGNKSCLKPYSISLFNISAMSFGALSANAILALNKGASMGGFAHDTGEGSVSKYHRVHGGDLIWEIGSGYFGCRNKKGNFDIDRFEQIAKDDQIKMIEIKLSQGAKPGHGGVLPAAKITEEIALTREIPMGIDCVSPPSHTAFSSSLEMLYFIESLRERSSGKPIGLKLCIGRPEDWFSIVKAMLDSKIYPDYFVIDGSEGGTGSAPTEFADHVGMPMREALNLVHATLIGTGLRSSVKLGVAGKIISAFDILRVGALGADWSNSARGFMFAIGCIQSRSCNTDRCPTGVATQDRLRQQALDPIDKAERVFNFHQNTMHALRELLATAGVRHLSELKTEMIMYRSNQYKAEYLSKFVLNLPEGSLLNDEGAFLLNQYHSGLGDAWIRSTNV